jgi:ABC-2 type transport system ATP-binding protein
MDENGLLLRVTDLRKSYGDVRAVDGVSFAVPRGTVFTLLGPNGAGKTTTLEILEGLREPDSGTIEVFGRSLRRVDRATKERMGVLLQEGSFEPYLKVKEVVALFASFFARPLPVKEVLERMELTEKQNALVRTLSGGQKQRLGIAVALVSDPELLFLDEPTTGLDPQARRNIWDVVRDLEGRGKTIILTTHYMEEAEVLSDDVAIMNHGGIIAQGAPRDLAARLGRETVIEFALAGARPEDLRELEALGTGLSTHGEVVFLKTAAFTATMERLLDWSKERRVALSGLVVRQPNLEDVFLSLTGRRLRE